ncbi:MAG TPA: protein kinase, partial [Polyangiales bacterium]|nr:protein kinase [Polyangiales bacterium]
MFADQRGTLGKYHLIAEIARGGMGIVYLALIQGKAGFNKLVVVKELKAELVEDPGFLTMFLDEARLAARLSHPNIVQTHEIG